MFFHLRVTKSGLKWLVRWCTFGDFGALSVQFWSRENKKRLRVTGQQVRLFYFPVRLWLWDPLTKSLKLWYITVRIIALVFINRTMNEEKGSEEMRAIDTANLFIELLKDNKDTTNLKLNKLLYFAQLASFERFDEPLFDENIEAWDYGPVVQIIYHTFKRNGADPITDTSANVDFSRINKEKLLLVIDVARKYGSYSADLLVDVSHQPGSPWEKTFRRQHGAVISPAEMRTFAKTEKIVDRFDPRGYIKENLVEGRRDEAGRLILPAESNL